jgi:hypothetical protein
MSPRNISQAELIISARLDCLVSPLISASHMPSVANLAAGAGRLSKTIVNEGLTEVYQKL